MKKQTTDMGAAAVAPMPPAEIARILRECRERSPEHLRPEIEHAISSVELLGSPSASEEEK